MSESLVAQDEQLVYQPPTLVEVGDFAELALGTVGLISDDGAFREN